MVLLETPHAPAVAPASPRSVSARAYTAQLSARRTLTSRPATSAAFYYSVEAMPINLSQSMPRALLAARNLSLSRAVPAHALAAGPPVFIAGNTEHQQQTLASYVSDILLPHGGGEAAHSGCSAVGCQASQEARSDGSGAPAPTLSLPSATSPIAASPSSSVASPPIPSPSRTPRRLLSPQQQMESGADDSFAIAEHAGIGMSALIHRYALGDSAALDALEQCPLLAPLSRAELYMLYTRAEYRHVPRYTRVVRAGAAAGERASGFHVLLRGSARSTSASSSVETRLTSGSSFGDASLLGLPQPYEVVTVSPCDVLLIGASALRGLPFDASILQLQHAAWQQQQQQQQEEEQQEEEAEESRLPPRPRSPHRPARHHPPAVPPRPQSPAAPQDESPGDPPLGAPLPPPQAPAEAAAAAPPAAAEHATPLPPLLSLPLSASSVPQSPRLSARGGWRVPRSARSPSSLARSPPSPPRHAHGGGSPTLSARAAAVGELIEESEEAAQLRHARRRSRELERSIRQRRVMRSPTHTLYSYRAPLRPLVADSPQAAQTLLDAIDSASSRRSGKGGAAQPRSPRVGGGESRPSAAAAGAWVGVMIGGGGGLHGHGSVQPLPIETVTSFHASWPFGGGARSVQ
jgi:hypothetical protein